MVESPDFSHGEGSRKRSPVRARLGSQFRTQYLSVRVRDPRMVFYSAQSPLPDSKGERE